MLWMLIILRSFKTKSAGNDPSGTVMFFSAHSSSSSYLDIVKWVMGWVIMQLKKEPKTNFSVKFSPSIPSFQLYLPETGKSLKKWVDKVGFSHMLAPIALWFRNVLKSCCHSWQRQLSQLEELDYTTALTGTFWIFALLIAQKFFILAESHFNALQGEESAHSGTTKSLSNTKLNHKKSPKPPLIQIFVYG